MLKLEDKEWRPIKIESIFSFIRGRENNMAMLENGDIPLISARNVNNGLKGFVKTPKKIIAGKCITLNNDGDGGAGLAYYQPADMALDTHVTALVPKVEMSMYTMIFISECLSKLHGFFGHGLSISNPRAEKIRILLPVTEDGKPDFQFMNDYMSELMKRKRKQYHDFIEKRFESLGLASANLGGRNELLKQRKWNPCKLSSLGTVETGRDIYALERVDGQIPYITSGSQNNGIGYFVANKNNTYDKGYIAFNRNGAVGLAFYHPYWSVMGNDCRKIHLNEADGNSYVGIFLATAISMQSKLFSYSRKLGTGRANKLQVMLPVTDDGQPDYDFMELFGRKMMANKYNQYLSFLALTEN